METSPANMIEATRAQAIADLEQIRSSLSERCMQLTHAEAEFDTLRRSEKDQSLQLQGALADVQHLGDTVQEQLAVIRQLEVANKKLAAEASTAHAHAEKAREDEGMVDLLRQALAGLQEDRRSMQMLAKLRGD